MRDLMTPPRRTTLLLSLLAGAVAALGQVAAPPPTATPTPTARATPAPKPTPKPKPKSEKDLPPAYRAWLEEVDALITRAERRVFLELDKDYQRDAFIERFWASRDPYPDTARNEMKEQWEVRLATARQEFGGLKEDRARMLLLNGFPENRTKVACNVVLWPLEIWIYRPSERVREPLVIVFYRSFGNSGPFRIWYPGEGVATLFQAPTPGSNDVDLISEIGNRCMNGDQVAGAIAHIVRQGVLTYSSLMSAAERPAEAPTKEWVATFNAYSTDVPPEARPLPAELSISFPSRRQNRTIVQGLLSVPAGEAGRADLAGHQSYNFLVNGEILRGRRLFDSFRYKFDFPAATVGDKIPLAFERFLRPGDYTLIVRVEDLNGERFFRTERPLNVPTIDGDLPPSLDPETARILEEANAAIDTGDDTIQLVEPRGEMQAGLVRFDTLTTGTQITGVRFALDGKPILTKTRPPYSVELDLGNVPRSRLLRAEALDTAGETLAFDELLINASAHRFAVHLVEPRRGERYVASLRAEARVELPEGAVVERVELFLNETLVATLYQEPFSQPIVLPPGEAPAYVRAVAYLPDGNATEDLVFVNAPDYLEEVEVQFVELYTTVLDRAKRPLQDLRREEFGVREDGVAQKLVRFERVENLPIHVGVLLDISASMTERLDGARQAALDFLNSAIQPRDRAALITFNDRPNLTVKFTNEAAELAGGLAGLKAERGTSLYDSVIFSLFYFNGIKGQRAILLLSDGKDEGSRFSFDDALDFARRAGVAIYPIGLDLPRTEFDTRRVLKSLAEETGGRAFFIKEIAELSAIYAEIQSELRSRYLLAYQSSNTARDSKFRTVEVTVARPGADAKTLRGYYP